MSSKRLHAGVAGERGFVRAALFSLLVCSFLTAPSAAASEACELQQVDSIDLAIGSNAHAVFVRATLNGASKYMVVDTGGVFNMLDRGVARELNLVAKDSPLRLQNVAGEAATEYVTVDLLQLGRFRPIKAEFILLPSSGATGRFGGDYGGILAPNILRNFDVEFDFAQGKMNLFKPSRCVERPYWGGGAVIDIDVRRNGHIYFPMVLDGKRVRAMLDTGMTSTSLSTRVAKDRFGVDPVALQLPALASLNGNVSGAIYPFTMHALSTQNGEITISNPHLNLLPLLWSRDSDEPELILGLSTLKNLRFYIAYGRERLFVSAASGPPAITPNLPEPPERLMPEDPQSRKTRTETPSAEAGTGTKDLVGGDQEPGH